MTMIDGEPVRGIQPTPVLIAEGVRVLAKEHKARFEFDEADQLDAVAAEIERSHVIDAWCRTDRASSLVAVPY